MDDELEAVARAFYEVSDYEVSWDQASPLIRAQMRHDARTAIRTLDDYNGQHLVDDFLSALHSGQRTGLSQRVH